MAGEVSILGTPQASGFEIIKTGLVDLQGPLTAAVNPSEVTVAHNLGFAPFVLAFIESSTLNIPLPYTAVGLEGTSDDGKVDYHVDYSVDSTNVYFTWTDSGQQTAGTFSIRYYLFRQRSD